MIPDKFFTWPWAMSLQPAVDYLHPLFEAAPDLKAFEENLEAGSLSGYTALVCRQWNISPAWVAVSLQREQSLLTAEHAAGKLKALEAASGFVGQDSGRVDRPGYYGVYDQVYRCVEQTAWLLGVLPPECWRELIRTSGRPARWRPGIKLEGGVEGLPPTLILGASTTHQDGSIWSEYTPLTAGEYVQLMYTPHWHVLAANETIAKQFGAQFF